MDETDLSIMEQLPNDVQDRIYNNFMFHRFLNVFLGFFKVPIGQSQTLYKWDNPVYREFMLKLLRGMQPRKYSNGEIIFNQLAEVGEVIFVEHGDVDVGFEISYKRYWVLRLFDHSIIGGLNCMANLTTFFLYRCASENFNGYSIKKDVWMSLMKDYDDISLFVSRKIAIDYTTKIRTPVMFEQNRKLQNLQQRHDQRHIQVIVEAKNFDVVRCKDLPAIQAIEQHNSKAHDKNFEAEIKKLRSNYEQRMTKLQGQLSTVIHGLSTANQVGKSLDE
jgi:hypothetical protein